MSVVRGHGYEVAYQEAGRSDTAVLLLHGFPFDRSMWRDQVEALRSNYHVITPDLRGLGESIAASEISTMEEMARDVVALLDELRIERPVVGGLSMGGYVALALHRLFPQRVGALVLADTRAGADTDEARRNREQLATRILSEGMDPVADAMLPKLLAPAAISTDSAVTARLRAMMLKTRPEGAAAALRGMAKRQDQTDFLPQISVPTLIIVGEEDSLTPPRESKLMHEKINNSRFATIPGAGHVSNIERPELFNRILTNFLDAIEMA